MLQYFVLFSPRLIASSILSAGWRVTKVLTNTVVPLFRFLVTVSLVLEITFIMDVFLVYFISFNTMLVFLFYFTVEVATRKFGYFLLCLAFSIQFKWKWFIYTNQFTFHVFIACCMFIYEDTSIFTVRMFYNRVGNYWKCKLTITIGYYK